jgi:hypothetical protein
MAVSVSAEQTALAIAQVVEQAIDAELDRLENMDDDELVALRGKRMKQLQEVQKQKQQWLAKGHGVYHILSSPDEFFSAAKKSERVVCHFGRSSTERSKVIDKHLRALAPVHFETFFCYVDVEKLYMLAEQFRVVMLPTIMLIEKGNTFHSIIGLDEFGGRDDFSTEKFCSVLAHYGMINDKGMFAADQTDE